MHTPQHSVMLEQKVQHKTALQQKCGWPKEPKRPMICLPAGMSETLGGQLFEELVPALLSQPLEILVLGKGSAKYGTLCTKLSKEHNHRFHIVPDKEEAIAEMYAAADMALFTGEVPESELARCLASGAVPVSLPHRTLDDYNPVQETGNAFLYDSADLWRCFAAIVRAVETYKFPFDWRTIQRHCQETATLKE